METQTVGRILVTAKMESINDLCKVKKGTLTADQVRSVEVHDALVDTGATILSMPKRLIDQLGLRPSAPERRGAAPVTAWSRFTAPFA